MIVCTSNGVKVLKQGAIKIGQRVFRTSTSREMKDQSQNQAFTPV